MSGAVYFYGGIILIAASVLVFALAEIVLFIRRRNLRKKYQ